MKTGTKSILFGAHQFILHPICVAIAWSRLRSKRPDIYTSLWNLPLLVNFIVHDWGYWGLEKMDDEKGEEHVELGASIMACLFDRSTFSSPWADFSRFHSRFIAKQYFTPISALCVADKLAFSVMPKWLYRLLSSWSGEIHEYIDMLKTESKYSNMGLSGENFDRWHNSYYLYITKWTEEHYQEPAPPPPWEASETLEFIGAVIGGMMIGLGIIAIITMLYRLGV